MRCPKCQYISYDHADRCRNCGYEFSLTPDVPDLDLPIRTGDEPVGPLADFALGRETGDETAPSAVPEREERPARSRTARSVTPAELPLFGDNRIDGDAPLVTLPASPRAPISVRRSAPSPAATEPADESRPDLGAARTARVARPREPHPAAAAGPDSEPHAVASSGARVGAGLIDVLLLALVDVGILALTLKACDLAWSELHLLPWIPFLAFLGILNGAYLSVFTAAGGQTIGKMATRIRVINADEHAPTDGVPLGQAIVRSAGYLASLLPGGLGFLPALIAADRRAVHDRIAHTRVVRA